jgi:ABC-type glycerol-3-phosphate transport system substrate-binding protein
MPRRHGWLHDYEYELDHGPERRVPSKTVQVPPSGSSPVNITINVNLGDLVDKIAQGKMKPKEALEEAIKRVNSKRQQLNERCDDD